MTRRGRATEPSSPMSGAVGARITQERSVRALSIEELARRASISAGLLSQLERGIGNPSLTTLTGLAHALELPVGSFFEGPSGDGDIVVHPETRKRLVLSDRDMTYQLLVPDLQGSLSLLWIELPPGFSNEEKPFNHAGEEAEIVLEGHIEAHIGDRTLQLRPGDSLRFASGVGHWYRTFEERVVLISATTPPSF